MRNAHLRMATIEYISHSKTYSTRVQVHSNGFAYSKDQAHMLSAFGNDAEVAAITAAISSALPLEARLPDGIRVTLRFGEKPVTFRGSLTVPGRTRPLRHLLAFSEDVSRNGDDGKVFSLHGNDALVWANVVSFLGLPATPEWAAAGMALLRAKGSVTRLDGFNCSPVLVRVLKEDLLTWLGEKLANRALALPEYNGAVCWPAYAKEALFTGEPGAAVPKAL